MQEVRVISGQTWHDVELEAVYDRLNTSSRGLTKEEAERRLSEFGPNELEEARKIRKSKILLAQLENPLNLVLVAAALISFLAGKSIDALIIAIIICFNTGMGFIQEYRAEKAIQALRSMITLEADVLRGCPQEAGACIEMRVRTPDLVPGDVILLESGDKVPADARLIEVTNLEVDESMLTGESFPVRKFVGVVRQDAPVADRKNLVYSGTMVTQGKGKAVVYVTGMKTEMGKIAKLIKETERGEAPIQKRTRDLSKKLGALAVVASALTLTIGLIRGFEFYEILLFALASAVSAIPEGLLVVMTIVLAVGAHRMVKRNALIRKLQAVETLGSVTSIITDKTGTLTSNQMTVRRLFIGNRDIDITGVGFTPEGDFVVDGGKIEPRDDPFLMKFLRMAMLSNDARLRRHQLEEGDFKWEIVGDPTEGALNVAASKAGLVLEDLQVELPRVDEIQFDPELRYMVTFHEDDAGTIQVFLKGAPEAILSMSNHIEDRDGVSSLSKEKEDQIIERYHDMAGDALRVLGFAYKTIQREQLDELKDQINRGEAEFIFMGLAGMIDPPRPEAKQSIVLCKRAGIKVVMATGDHKLTAEAIAKEIGISLENSRVVTGEELNQMDDQELDSIVESTSVFARVSPVHKHRIVQALKREENVVAMTGDGVNDAPALKASDVGISMGITGTDVTKETADMVLTDDNFASIVSAVEEGRVVFENIRKVVKYLISTNTGEIITILTTLILLPTAPLILTPIMILWINLVTDGLLDKTLALESKEEDIMDDPPKRPDENIIDRQMMRNVIIMGILMATGSILLFHNELTNGSATKARTFAFTTMAMFQVFNSLNCRSRRESVFELGFFTNRYLFLAIGASVTLLFLATAVPFLQTALGTTALSLMDWITVVLVSSSVLAVDELRKYIEKLREPREPSSQYSPHP